MEKHLHLDTRYSNSIMDALATLTTKREHPVSSSNIKYRGRFAFLLAVIFLLVLSPTQAQSDPLVYTIGNLADLPQEGNELKQFEDWLEKQNQRSVFILNGDVLGRKNSGIIHPEDSLRLYNWLSMNNSPNHFPEQLPIRFTRHIITHSLAFHIIFSK